MTQTFVGNNKLLILKAAYLASPICASFVQKNFNFESPNSFFNYLQLSDLLAFSAADNYIYIYIYIYIRYL
jgi:hypothetical protein